VMRSLTDAQRAGWDDSILPSPSAYECACGVTLDDSDMLRGGCPRCVPELEVVAEKLVARYRGEHSGIAA
jgi:hypothetical protein